VSPLGPIESWPQSLKTAVELMLHSRQPAYVGWGRALVTLYNDASIPLLGGLHPGALGKPYSEIWSNRWADMAPVIEAVMAGEPQHVAGQRVKQSADPASWYTFSWTPLRDEMGTIAGFYCVATETTLQLVDEQLRTVLENTRDGVNMLDLQSGKYVYMSPAHVALTGFSAEELHNLSAAESLQRVHPDDRETPARQLQRLSDGTEAESTAEYRWRVKSGEYHWFSVSRKLVRDPSGQPVALVGVSRDITPQKEAELEALAGRAKLEAALRSMTDAVFIADADGRFIHLNEAFARFHRFKSLEQCFEQFAYYARLFEGRLSDGQEVMPEDWPVSRALRGETGVGTELLVGRKDTGETWIGSYSFGPIRDRTGKITGAVVTARDITEAKKAEETLRSSQARLNLALESAEMGTWEWDVQSDRAIWNAKLYELLGLPPASEEVGGTFFRHVHPEDLPEVQRSLKAVIEVGTDWRAEFRIIRADGELRWWVGVGRLFRNADGSPRAMLGVNYDVSEQRHAEGALRESEKQYRLLHETQRDGFVRIAMDGRILESNEILRQMLGYSAEEIGALTYLDLTPERWHAFQADIVRKQIIQRGYSDVYEKEYQRKDGSTIPVELRTILSRDSAGNPESMWAIVRDITERKANEARLQALKDELIHVGRVSELSQVSAGIAHELNQPLAAMLNYSTAAKRMIEKADRGSIESAQKAIEKAGEQAQRAGEIIRRMRDFVEKHDTNRKPTMINAIVEEAVALGLIGAKSDGIVTHLNLSDDLPPVLADRVQIQQVVVNLLRNAIDAMANSATRELTVSTKVHNASVEVVVTDTGSGIPASVMDRLFQPFVTTKTGGMGIGLAISRSIIEAHGGDIAVEPQPTGGTVFRFSLPAAPPTP
jgi:two-component system sensor kinase FixL